MKIHWRFLVIAAVLQLVWGFVPSASQFVINEIPVELYVAIRWTISGFIFAAYLYFTKTWTALALKDLLAVALFGALGYGVASIGMLHGLHIGGVSNFALMGSLGPVMSSCLSIWILRETPNRGFYLALPAVFLGLILLVVGKYQISSIEVAGLAAALIIGGYALEAFVFVSSKTFKPKMGHVQYLAIAQIATALMMWFLQLTTFHQCDQIYSLSLRGFAAAMFVSIVACVFCFAILYWLLNHIPGHRLALFDSFHALSATLFGYFLFAETLNPLMIAGGILILIGVLAGNWPQHAIEELPE